MANYGHDNIVKVGSSIPSHDHDDHASRGEKHLWGGIVIGILTVFLVASFYYLFKKILPALIRRKTQLPLMKKKVTIIGTLKDEKNMLRGFELEEVVKATKNFSQECLLGSGAFGNVYKGNFDVERTLAIKRPHNESYQSAEEFMNGAQGSKMLVYEYVPNGSLLEYITENYKEYVLDWKTVTTSIQDHESRKKREKLQRANIAIGAAKGIAHLHEGIKPSIIHRDIKPSNILVGDWFEAKVSDFGLVTCGPTGDQSHVSSQVKGTPGYLDPAYCSSFHLTPFSDVYSFGVILLQLITARPAIESAKINSNYHIVEWARPSLERGKVEDIFDVNLLSEPCNMKMMQKMGQLGLRCAENTPKQRPLMTQVWQELQEALYLAENFINKQPSWDSHKSVDYEDSQTSFVSINEIGFQRFHVEMESLSFQSTVLRCLDKNNSIGHVDIEKNSSKRRYEEKSKEDVC